MSKPQPSSQERSRARKVTKLSARLEPKIPKTITLEMTPRFYNAYKEDILKKQNPLVRSHINTYFEWLKSITPEDVVDAITKNISAQQAYQQLGANPVRLGIAAARGLLKVTPKYRTRLNEVMTLDLALLTLKFENPDTFQVITAYGENGKAFVTKWIEGAKEILGVVIPPKIPPTEEKK